MSNTRKCPTCGHSIRHHPQPEIFIPFDGTPNFLNLWLILTNVGIWVCRDGSKRRHVDVLISFMESVAKQVGATKIRVISQKEFMSMTNEQRAKFILAFRQEKKKKIPSKRKEPVKREVVRKESTKEHREIVSSKLAEMAAFFAVSREINEQSTKDKE